MTDTTKAQILDLARKAINTEMLALKHMKETLGDNFADAVELILACSGKCIVTGMGKSGLVGRKIAATLASTGTPSFFLHPGEAFHGDLGMISKDDVVLALSYSGETDEILKIVPFIHSNGNKLVSMTGNPESALAKNSDIHLDVSVEEEACILHLAPTTSTTAQIAMGDALAVSLMQMRGFTSVDFARLHPGGSLGRRLLMTVGNVMRDHDLPVLREVLAVDDDKVVRQDADAEHRLAAHTQGEILVIVPAGVERQVVLDALLRQNRVTGGNIAEDRHLTAARGKLVDLDGLRRNGNGLQLLFERDGTALARALLNEPHLLQVLDMEVDRGG